jgi:DNA-binding SARP family transcriptional activator
MRQSQRMVRIALFGRPRVWVDGSDAVYTLPRKTLHVLAYLILHADRPPTRESVAFALFPDEDEERARASLRRNLSYLFSSLPPSATPYVLNDGDRLTWNQDAPARVDVLELRAAVAAGNDDAAATAYGGDLLPAIYDDWTAGHRERLRAAAHAALLRMIAHARAQRNYPAAATHAQRLLDEDPWREDVVRHLMAVRYESGDRAAALATYVQFGARLQAEMAAEPMPETQALRAAILQGARLATTEPLRSEVLETLPFSGRERELQIAVDHWHTCADGRAGALFIGGEAGIGKTRFAVELARATEREGGATLLGETSAGGETRPYEAILEALRNAGIDRALANAGEIALSNDGAARVRLYETIRSGVREASRARPLVLVLEDLHWAGPATIDLLAFLIDGLGDAPVMIACTYRTDELPRAHPLTPILRALSGRARVATLALDRLDDATAERALRRPADTAADSSVRDAIAWAAGVPLLLTEALRDLRAGQPFSASGFDETIGDRFAALPAETVTALTYAAIFGSRFDLSTLAAATSWRDERLIDALAPALEIGLIAAAATRAQLAFAFSHHLVHAAVVRRIAPGDRTRLHALAARTIRSTSRDDAHAAEIARHFVAAGEPLAAAESFAAAARYALAVYANEDARDAATAGYAAACDGGAGRQLRFDIVALRERANARLGAVAERDADTAIMLTLADDPAQHQVALERRIDALIGDEPQRRDALAELAALGASSPAAQAAYERVRAQVAANDGDFITASACAHAAAALFATLGDESARLRALFLVASADAMRGQLERASALADELRPIVEARDDAALRLEYYNVSAGLGADERHAIAVADAERMLELALRVGDRAAEARARWNRAYSSGDMDFALREYTAAHTAFRAVGDRTPAVTCMLNIVATRGWYGALDEIEPDAPHLPWLAMQIAMQRATLQFRRGEDALALEAMQAVRATSLERDMPRHAARLLACIGEARARLGDSAVARRDLEAALVELTGSAMPFAVAEVEALLARLDAECGAIDAARARIASAGEALERFAHLITDGKPAWDLAAAAAVLGDGAAARHHAENALRAFGTTIATMDADLAEGFGQLPWHIDACAYLAGRDVRLMLETTQTPTTM